MSLKKRHYSSVLISSLFLSASLFATNRYIDPAGSDVSNDCSVLATPCATLQNAVDQSSPGDTIIAAAGTYALSGMVSVYQTLTILGAQAGVDARTRSGAESILSNTQGISVSASDVVFDGFTIQDSSDSALTGYGIWLNPGVDGTQIVNNIFQNNIAGLGLANAGTMQCLIQYNLFQDNNLSGGASGTGIYTDQYVGGVVSNVLIADNAFVNNDTAGIGFSSTTPATPDTNIGIINNAFQGSGAYFFSVDTVSFGNNTLTNITAPVAIGIYGGANNLLILDNTLETGAQYGIYADQSDGTGVANSNITIDSNSISGYAVDAIGFFAMAPAFPTPATPDTNIAITNNMIDTCGTGAYFYSVDTVSFEDNTVTNTTGAASVFVGGGASNVSVRHNSLVTGAEIGILIGELDINGTANTDIAIHRNNIFGYALDGMYVLNEPVGPTHYAVCNWWGDASGPFNATLNPTGFGDGVDGTVAISNFLPWLLSTAPDAPCGLPPTLSKSFSPSMIFEGQKSLLRITLTNSAAAPATLLAPLVDNLPSGVTVVGAIVNTCGGTLTATTGSSTVTLTGGIIPASDYCEVMVRVIGGATGTQVNTLPAGALQTDIGSNVEGVSATLNVVRRPGR